MNQHNTNIVKRMLAQFYMDMCKGLLLLGFAYGLFGQAMQDSSMRPYIIILVPIVAIISGFFSYGMLGALEHEKEDKDSEK